MTTFPSGVWFDIAVDLDASANREAKALPSDPEAALARRITRAIRGTTPGDEVTIMLSSDELALLTATK